MRSLALLAAAGLAATVALTAPLASAAAPVRLLTGETPESSAFPADRFTVADPAQLTGRRVALPVPACGPDTRSTCDALQLLNTLDGFDLQPRVFLPFSGDIDVRTVTPATVYVEGAGTRVGLQQLTYDPGGTCSPGRPASSCRSRRGTSWSSPGPSTTPLVSRSSGRYVPPSRP